MRGAGEQCGYSSNRSLLAYIHVNRSVNVLQESPIEVVFSVCVCVCVEEGISKNHSGGE